MATRVIKYIPKHTGAGTEYREIEDDDKHWILNQCIRALSVMAEYDRIASTDEGDDLWIRDQWWHKKSKSLHKGKDGMNSPCSVLGGIVHNMMFKDPAQRDFSNKQMTDIENIFNGMAHYRTDIQPVRFQIGFGS
jgi:hypothetical protein